MYFAETTCSNFQLLPITTRYYSVPVSNPFHYHFIIMQSTAPTLALAFMQAPALGNAPAETANSIIRHWFIFRRMLDGFSCRHKLPSLLFRSRRMLTDSFMMKCHLLYTLGYIVFDCMKQARQTELSYGVP